MRPATPLAGEPPRTYMVDSGASFHLISRKFLTNKEKATIKPLWDPIKLHTANSVVKCTEHVPIYVKELDLTLIALVLGNAPAVLSMGKLCTENNLRYVWDGPIPYLQNKANKSRKGILLSAD